MSGAVYYNEFDPYAAQWICNLAEQGLVPGGLVDDRSIREVQPEDLRAYDQCHFFAGVAGWALALQLAGWPATRPVWTGSCPCQPFSSAGKRRGFADERHLWPAWLALIAQRRPPTIFGEQSAKAADWLGLVRSDLEALGYAVGAMPIEAASAGADVLGDRFWFVATTDFVEFRQEPSARQQPQYEHDPKARVGRDGRNYEWRRGADGKKRRTYAGIDLLAHAVPARMGKLRGLGNAIDPHLAARFISAFIESEAA